MLRKTARPPLAAHRACEACERATVKAPIAERSRIRFSAKFRDRVFEAGAVLCEWHSVGAVKP